MDADGFTAAPGSGDVTSGAAYRCQLGSAPVTAAARHLDEVCAMLDRFCVFPSDAQRDAIVDLRRSGEISNEVMHRVERELGEQGPGEFAVPDLVKFKVKVVPAKPAHTGLDPFTKQERDFPAKPASRKVRATPGSRLKKLA